MANADACVNFACKRPNFANVGGGGEKWQNFADVLYGWPLTLTHSIDDSDGQIKTITLYSDPNLKQEGGLILVWDNDF